MDYEKRYKDALEVAKRKLCMDKAGLEDTFTPDDIREIFPELAESEDEKIIYDAIKEVCNVEDARAFAKHNETVFNVAKRVLEKQGDHDNFRNKIQIGDKVTRNKDGVLVNLSQLNRVAKKQGEQKPVEWSEEDANYMNSLIEYLNDINFHNDSRTINGHRIEFVISWLKSIKDRCLPQPQQEWTMQDEEELQIALDTLVKAGQHSSAKWLKNVCLVPQSQWKPSDEQMYILNWVANILLNHDGVVEEEASKKLQSLYNDLKELKG